MKNNFLIKIIIYFGVIFFIEAKANISNSIIAKVGSQIITNLDVENEIKTILFLSKQEVNQENINSAKGFAINEIVKRLVKRNETLKYGIKDYSKTQMNEYFKMYFKNLNTNSSGFKKKLKKNGINYNFLVTRVADELMWNKLILIKYNNKIKINMNEVENEMNKIVTKGILEVDYNLYEIEISNNKNEDIEKTLKDIYAFIKKNGFKNAAKEYSISTSSLNEGSLGWVSGVSLSKQYFNELNKLQKGGTSQPIVNGNSIVLLHIEDKKETRTEIKNLEKIKKKLISKKKNIKLELLSRSHYSRIENQTLVRFK